MRPSGSSWGDRLRYLGQRMMRQKEVGEQDMKTELCRCLTTPQLTLLGVGNTIGVGIYVMLGVMAKENAGPAVVFSFAAAIFVTLMNALVFAEFATYIPQTGASYVYIYKVFGEFAAFLCGWVMMTTYAFSSSVGARAWSGMLDSFFNHSVQEHTINIFGKIQFGMPFAESLDVLAFIFQIAIIIIVSCNVLCSSIINTILGVLTSSVLVFVFVMGLVYGNADNFKNADHGGFFPFGIAGVVKGASLALYATSGFEVISLSAEEAKNPSKSVPRAVLCELLIVGLVYIGAAIGMLFLIPYYLIDTRSPLPSAFEHSGVPWAKVVVTVGPMFGITNLQMLGVYGLSRVMYRMAKDGLFLEWFLKVNKRTGAPLNSVVCVGFVTSISALLFDLSYIVKITVVLMLLNNLFTGSALIKLRITETVKKYEPVKEPAQTKSLKTERDYYENEVVVSEYETCDSTESVDAETTVTDGNVSTDNSILVDVSDSYNVVNGLRSGDSPSRGKYETEAVLREDSSKVTGDAKQEENLVDLVADVEDLKLVVRPSVGAADEETEDETLFEHPSLGAVDRTSPNSEHELSKSKSDGVSDSLASSPKTLDATVRKSRMARALSPFIPGVMSVNVVLLLHWVVCMSIAVQANLGWADITAGKLVSVLSMSLLVILLVFLSFLLSSQCEKTRAMGFQTSLMPFVPTLSMLSSSMLLFSAGDLSGLIEVAILMFTGSVIYVIMVQVNFTSEPRMHRSGATEESKGLVAGSGDDADDEIESDEF